VVAASLAGVGVGILLWVCVDGEEVDKNMIGELFSKYVRWLGKSAEREIEKEIGEMLIKDKKIVYLDCGCDDGEKTAMRAKVIGTEKVRGIDNQAERLKIAEKRGIKIYAADLNKKWPMGSGSVDLITATEVIEHLVDIDNFMFESGRVLKRGGRLIVSTENLAAWHNVVALIMGNQPYTGPYISRKLVIGHHPHDCYRKDVVRSEMNPHLNVMTSKALRQLLRGYGFRIEKMAGVAFYPWVMPIAKILSKIDAYHASYVVVSAKKI
jgi:ubiquinone/menaquinone biosynthesis C-methylase UbiE